MFDDIRDTLFKGLLRELKEETEGKDDWYYCIDGEETKDLERVAQAMLDWKTTKIDFVSTPSESIEYITFTFSVGE